MGWGLGREGEREKGSHLILKSSSLGLDTLSLRKCVVVLI